MGVSLMYHLRHSPEELDHGQQMWTPRRESPRPKELAGRVQATPRGGHQHNQR